MINQSILTVVLEKVKVLNRDEYFFDIEWEENQVVESIPMEETVLRIVDYT